MNHHTRSYSEQPQIAPQVAAPVAPANNGLAQPQSFIRIHSDSQQSLDQLFNPTLTSSVPLRNRNLPSSFFNPSVKTDNGTNGTNGNHTQANNLHNRSISFDQRNPNVPQHHRQNFHMRTHSTLAPMPRLDSNHSSHQSSHEFLNTSASNATNNVSSCQQLGENIVSSTSTNNHNHNHHQHQQQRHLHHHSHSNGWSSAGNSIDDLSSTSWVAGQQQQQQQPPVVVHQPMQVVQHHQPTIMHEHSVQVQPTQQQPQHQTSTNIVANNQQPMFYGAAQQTVAAADTTTTPMVATSHVCPNHSFHSRSLSSYQQRPSAVTEVRANHGFHMRTHSTVAPISSTCHRHHQQATSHHSSHQSSQEILNHSSATNGSTAAGWSSSGYSTDDLTSAGVGHTWRPNHNPHQHSSQSQLHITQQPMSQAPTMDHQPSGATSMTTLPTGHNHLHHHHHHIPLQVQQQNAHQQQLFYNV